MHLTGSLFTAGPFTQRQIDQIRTRFEAMLHCKLTLDVKEDPSLLGGFVARIDGKVYDASIRTQLMDLEQALLTGKKNRTDRRKKPFAAGGVHNAAR